MDNNLQQSAEKCKIDEALADDTRIEMETRNIPATNTANTIGPKRKKFKKHKKYVDRIPLMLFNETFQSMQFIEEGASHKPEFVVSASLEGVKYEGRARSKKVGQEVRKMPSNK